MSRILVSLCLLASWPPIAAGGGMFCEGRSQSLKGKVKARVSDDGTVVLESSLAAHPVTFKEVANVWDGHRTGLITAAGLYIKYENQFGCIRNVEIGTDVRAGTGSGFIDVTRVPLCSGGTSPEAHCSK